MPCKDHDVHWCRFKQAYSHRGNCATVDKVKQVRRNSLVACQVILTPKALTLATLDNTPEGASTVQALAPVALACRLCGGSSTISVGAAGRLVFVIHGVMASGESIRGVQLIVAVHVTDGRAPGAAPHGLHREHVCAAGLLAVQAVLHWWFCSMLLLHTQ